MLTLMVISVLAIDPSTKSPIMILKEASGERTLPIWIGIHEAHAIASELEGIKLSRPMTHDLFKNILDSLGIEINRIEISDLKNNTYYAIIYFTHKGNEISIDARPSDAIALSLRFKTPIYVAEEVINKSAQIDLKIEQADKSEQEKRWQEILEKLDPEDLGKA